MTEPIYEIDHLFTCPTCQHSFSVHLHHVVLPDSPAWDALAQGMLNSVICPACGNGGIIEAPFLLLHADGQATCFIPDIESLSHDQQQDAVDVLLAMLARACADAGLEAPDTQSVGASSHYEVLVQGAHGTLDTRHESYKDDALQYALEVVQALVNASPAERTALLNQVGETAPMLAELVRHMEEQAIEEQGHDAPLVAALQELRRDLLAPPTP